MSVMFWKTLLTLQSKSARELENTKLVSFDIKLIRRDQKQRRKGRPVIEKIMLVPFDIKFIRRDQNQRRNGEACRRVIENTMLVSFDINLLGETRNSVGMVRLVEQ